MLSNLPKSDVIGVVTETKLLALTPKSRKDAGRMS